MLPWELPGLITSVAGSLLSRSRWRGRVVLGGPLEKCCYHIVAAPLLEQSWRGCLRAGCGGVGMCGEVGLETVAGARVLSFGL